MLVLGCKSIGDELTQGKTLFFYNLICGLAEQVWCLLCCKCKDCFPFKVQYVSQSLSSLVCGTMLILLLIFA